MAERSSTRKQSTSRSSGSSSRSSGSSSRSSGNGRSSGSRSRSSGNGRSSGSRSSNGSSSRRSNSKLSGREAIERALSEAGDLLGRPIESVLGLESDDREGWRVTVEVVELERIPRSTDVLGAYVITLDKSGELTGTRRERRYYRNQADEE